MKNRGFSLVELSIVLVILGLLTGGILAGQNLIRAAELRAVTTELQSYQTAAQTFRDKYFALPGDMRNATDFWGSTTCPGTAGTGTQTCNGDGDGRIGFAAASQYAENFTFWQHLANAGLIEGSYTGIAGSSGVQHSTVGVNIPRARLSNAAWGIASAFNFGGDASAYAVDYGNFFFFGSVVTNGGAWGPVISPEEAWNIDTKVDDGLPAQGRVIARYWNNACAAANDGGHAAVDLDASYRLSETGSLCALHFVRLF